MNTAPPNPHPRPQPSAPVYAGVNIAKATLQLHFQARPHLLDNTPAGCAQRLALVRKTGNVPPVCEATGGYEQGLLTAAHTAGQPVSVLNPAQVRYFALAQGQRAKNDPPRCRRAHRLRHRLVPGPHAAPGGCHGGPARPGAVTRPRPGATDPRPANPRTRRARLRGPPGKTAHRRDDGTGGGPPACAPAPSPSHGPGAVGRRGFADRAERAHLDAGVGHAESPRSVGLGGTGPPWARPSGPWQGQRHIDGGRAAGCHALYLSAVVLARMPETTLGKFYARLRAAGKPAKVALTAGMRKRLLQMNRELQALAVPTQAVPIA